MRIDEMPVQTIGFQCRNCGECCGPIPFTPKDKERIIDFLVQTDTAEIARVRNQKRPPLTCQFRDMEKKNCFIHPVRPEICKMQGYYIGLECPHQPQFATKGKEEGHKRLHGVTEI